MQTLTQNLISAILKPRVADSHKGDYGHALLVAGSDGKMGAAVIAARACLRSGVGLLSVVVPRAERIILQVTIPEAMLVQRDNLDFDISKFSALGVGPALGTDSSAKKLLNYIFKEIKKTPKPLLLDADALNIISLNSSLLKKIPENTILTPHPKEFDRLFGAHDSTEARIQTALKKSEELNCVIVLKGHHTLITSGGKSFLNSTGNAGLAKGGSGDALTGIITAFLAQGYAPFDAAKLGVFIHGFAADLTLNEQSMESMLITDVIENLGKVFKVLVKA